mmetsp:Transcript_8229/g.23129  ORF Transcript_8229/g.23129 Transcript_8229/m.23129 type:complete len:213 (+) Transcript_8229:376-1014(+)
MSAHICHAWLQKASIPRVCMCCHQRHLASAGGRRTCSMSGCSTCRTSLGNALHRHAPATARSCPRACGSLLSRRCRCPQARSFSCKILRRCLLAGSSAQRTTSRPFHSDPGSAHQSRRRREQTRSAANWPPLRSQRRGSPREATEWPRRQGRPPLLSSAVRSRQESRALPRKPTHAASPGRILTAAHSPMRPRRRRRAAPPQSPSPLRQQTA